MALISLKLGSYEGGIRWCQKAAALNDKVPLFARPPTFALLARLWLRQSDLPQAQAALADSLVDYDPNNTMPGVWSYITVPPAQIEVGLALGETAQAEAAVGEMLAVLERLNYRGHQVEAWLMQAMVDLAQGRNEEAHTALQNGWELAETMGERQDSWRILWELSRLEAAAGKHDEAEHYRLQAREVVAYIADHAGSDELRASFVAMPEVAHLLTEAV
jgi:tetratricopeptide (TPR) repeat protein